MMKSPGGIIEEYNDKSYTELIFVRDDLIAKIRDFEKCKIDSIDSTESNMNSSLQVVYRCNLDYLGRVCKLISEKYNREFLLGENNDDMEYIFKIRDFLNSKGLRHESTLDNKIWSGNSNHIAAISLNQKDCGFLLSEMANFWPT